MANGKRLPHPGRESGAGKPLQLRNQRRRCAGPMIYSAEELYSVVDEVAGGCEAGWGSLLTVAIGWNRPILLKKSAMVPTVEKYAFEIEIFTLSRGFGVRFRVAARKKGVFSGQYAGSLEEPTFSTESARNGQPSVPFSLGRLELVVREQTPLGIPACATPPPCPVPSSSIRWANTANYSPSAPKPDNRTAPACATIRYAPRQSVLGTADTTRDHLDRADGALRDDLEWVGCVGGELGGEY
ncbi:hypothetical protein SAMN05216585_3672 [Pseudomonas chlororaphis]|nr:hypothetical protein SAMN05216585_3672 [Pseudomonas chlororaphis]